MARGAGDPVTRAGAERAGAADDDDRWAARLKLVPKPHRYQPLPDDWDDDEDDEPLTWLAALLMLAVVLGFWGVVFYAWRVAW